MNFRKTSDYLFARRESEFSPSAKLCIQGHDPHPYVGSMPLPYVGDPSRFRLQVADAFNALTFTASTS